MKGGSDSDFSEQTIVQSTTQRARTISAESPLAFCPISAECLQLIVRWTIGICNLKIPMPIVIHRSYTVTACLRSGNLTIGSPASWVRTPYGCLVNTLTPLNRRGSHHSSKFYLPVSGDQL